MLSGYGSTTVETSDGRKHSFEWGPKSLFALPLNARYQHFNTSGREHARLASVNNLCLKLNLFHNEAFVFDNAYEFPERQGAASHFSGEGEFVPVRPGPQHVGDEFHPRSLGLRAQDLERARRRRLQHDVRARRRHHARPHLADAGRHLQEGATATAPTSTSSPSPATAIRCSGTTSPRTWCASTGSTASCSRRPTRCSTSTSTPRPIRRAISRSPSGACAIRSRQSKRHVFMGMDVNVQGRRLPDRIRGPGPAHPPHLSRRAGQARRQVRHGQVHRRERATPKAPGLTAPRCTTSNSTTCTSPPARSSTRSPGPPTTSS